MATITVPFTDLNLYKHGTFTGPTTVSGRSAYTTVTNDAEIEIYVTGNQITLPYNTANANRFAYYIDGVLTQPTLATTAWPSLVISLTDGAPRHFRIKKDSGSGSVNFDATTFLTIDGAAPAIASVNKNAGIPLYSNSNVVSASTVQQTANGWSYLSLGFPDASYKVKADFTGVTGIEGWVYRASGPPKVDIWVDNALPTQQATYTNTSRWEWVSLASGLNLSSVHELEAYVWAATHICSQIRFVTTTGTPSPALQAATAYTKRVGFMGDSITWGHIGVSEGYVRYLHQSLGWGIWNRAVQSTTIAQVLSTQWPQISAISPALDQVNIMSSINDVSVTSLSSFRTSWDSLLSSLASSAISVVHIWKIFPSTSKNAAAVAPYNQAIIDAVAANGNSKFKIFDVITGPAGTFDPTTGVHTLDGLHPNTAGNLLLATNYMAQLTPVIPPLGSLNFGGGFQNLRGGFSN